jgi:phosphatidylglycerol:prolipoprotein diacylglycerol transferase
MYPILGRYGPFFLYSYTVVMALGLACGVGLTAWLERRDGAHHPGWIDGLIVAIVAGLAGGRAGFVIANWTYFSEEPGEIGLVWQGGLSYHGALLAGMLGLLTWAVWRRRSFARVSGLFAPGLVLVSAFGWLACWFEGCAYGREAAFGPLVADLPDSYGVYALRYQTQLMGVIFCLLIFPLIYALRNRLRPGLLLGFTLVLLSAGRLVITLFRGDGVMRLSADGVIRLGGNGVPILGSLRWDTVLDGSIAIVVLLLVGLTATWRLVSPLPDGRRSPGKDKVRSKLWK